MPDSFTRPDVAAFLAYANALPGPRTHEVDPPQAREMFRMAASVADLPRGEIAVVKDLAIPGPAGAIPARLYDARDTRDPGPVIVFFHGGGWVIGDLATHDSPCAEMARTLDLPVVSIDYRLAPEHPWPAAPDDCEAAARWIAAGPAELDGRAATGLVLCGDSAGGNLTITVALDLRDAPAAVPVIAQLPIYPAADMNTDYPSFALHAEGKMLTRDAMRYFDQHYAPDKAHQRGSPMVADLAGLPPAVVLTAGLDPIRDQGRAYAAALAIAGVPVVFQEARGTIHGFLNLRRAIPSGQQDFARFLAAAKQLIADALPDAAEA